MRLPFLSPSPQRALLLLLLGPPGLSAAHGPTETSVGASTGLCEARTINYITHTLPQLCLPTAWSASQQMVGNATNPTATGASPTGSTTETATATQGTRQEEAPVESNTKPDPSTGQIAQDGTQGTQEEDTKAKRAEEDSEDLATESFMSFDEWKAMMLKKSGQDLADLKDRKRREARDADPGVGSGLDGWGEDGEISLDFDVLSDKISEMTATDSVGAGAVSTNAPNTEVQDTTMYDNGVAHYRRPKDAGKTCKERFSYSSFDGGATVLKTTPGAQNPKAILVENKDSYMLFTCSQENKFVIVELSEDILVDTVVLANFEFFSSMIRSFRVSVSDKYPVKMEKWKDLGTFQARNSRDIQSFLIENPKIWAKYIRIELLSHYGNEYYCPVSLLRVHGTRMLDSWKDGEAGLEDDEPAETIDGPEAVPEEEPMHQSLPETEAEPTHAAEVKTTVAFSEVSFEHGLSPWYPPLFNDPSYDTCGIGTPTMTETIDVSPSALPNKSIPSSSQSAVSTDDGGVSATAGNSTVESTVASSPSPSISIFTNPPSNTSTPSASHTATSNRVADTVADTTQTIQKTVEADIPKSSMTPPKASASAKTQNSPPSKPAAKNSVAGHSPHQPSKTNSQNRSTTNTSSSAAASPTVQESFFKSVSKRLQFLESNTTLSLQYIEEQSKFLQEALKKMERKQISRVDSFLDNLNSTVFSELRRVRQDYDQIWQSTVIALETQREQSQRDIIALRDEVIFQKRMAIFQSVLLLCCLVLVVFSRGVFGGSGVSADQWPISSTSQFINSYLGSPRWPPGSPQSISRSNTPDRNGNVGTPQPAGTQAPVPRHGVARRRVSYTDKVLPLTPTSEEFDSNDNGTPPPLPRSHTQKAPKIRINEITPDEEYFDRDRLDQGSDGNSTATPQAFEPVREDPMSTVAMHVSEDEEGDDEDEFSDSASAPYLDSRDSTVEVESVQRLDDLDEDTMEPSKPPLTRSPLSELGAESSRKPLPALPEQDPT
ncbi:hypothetical protein KVR01_008567 [Diaporthe batatas]|uniref:uncharacterized protein n=1 Tax=Diaporthe batatas TaxID=748121 RepID=UPI001D054887|nr:uncharacterized protein KVR01_008567 [Diaporthe batatas]KAG8161580.1 hypothetical protein KVR01_008567 [Diaporthe batatas]